MVSPSGVQSNGVAVSVTDGAAPIALKLQGWGNPTPVAIQIAERRDLARLRSGIKEDLAKLLPRCEALEQTLSEQLRCHRGYAGSKLHHKFGLELAPADTVHAPAGHPIDPRPAIRHPAATVSGATLSEMLSRARRVVCVGDIAHPALRAALSENSPVTTKVEPGDGEATVTRSGRSRPGTNSFSAWLAMRDEDERAEAGAFVLGRQASRTDLALLRHRVHAHHLVFVEAGSAVLTWLLAEWDGVTTLVEGVFVFSEPAIHFREPSRRIRMAPDAGWPRITVVTVSYNQRIYLEQCLLSVLDQHYPNLEYIVVDAGSTDGSVELLRRYECRFTKLIVEPDKGQSDGLNKGFRLATGDILTWVNSDDMLAPLALKRAAMAMHSTGANLVAGTCKRIDENARVLYKHHSALPALRSEPFTLDGPLNWCDAWEQGDYFFQPEVFFSRSIWERAGGYLKQHLFWAMDWELWLRCSLAGASIVRIPDVLGISREHGAQKTKMDEMYLWQIAGILREYDDLLAAIELEAGAA
jgi:GT2 family glycosyltransferase